MQAIFFLCFTTVISSLASAQSTQLELSLDDFPLSCARTCLPIYKDMGCGNPILKECFCSLPNPLVCAWRLFVSQPLDYACWNSTERWYETQCPSVKPIDEAGVPSCARRCFEDPHENACLEYTRNCICSQGKPPCSAEASSCNGTELGIYDSWFAGECPPNPTNLVTKTEVPMGSASTTTSGISHTSSTTSDVPGTIFPVEDTILPVPSTPTGIVAGASVAGFMGTLLIATIYILYRRKQKQPRQQESRERQAAEMLGSTAMPAEASGIPRPLMELFGSTMIPVEAPTSPRAPAELFGSTMLAVEVSATRWS